MRKGRLIVFTLGLAAALTIAGLAVSLQISRSAAYRRPREAAELENLEITVPVGTPRASDSRRAEALVARSRSRLDRREARAAEARAVAARAAELVRMGPERAIPYIIEMWGEDTGEDGGRPTMDDRAGAAALVLIGDPAIPFLRDVLCGQIEDPTGGKRTMACITCQEMGPAALPLLPELLELYRNTRRFRSFAAYAIRAIGEAESVKEVEGADPFRAHLRRLQAESVWRQPGPKPGTWPMLPR